MEMRRTRHPQKRGDIFNATIDPQAIWRPVACFALRIVWPLRDHQVATYHFFHCGSVPTNIANASGGHSSLQAKLYQQKCPPEAHTYIMC